MKCPVCEDVRMREVEKNGVMIDVCPDCKGVWLDRGELDKLMRGVHELQEEIGRMEQEPYDRPPQAAPGAAPHAPYGGPPPGYGPQQGYGTPQQGYGYDQRGHHYGHGKSKYDKHGYPYKKKKSVLDVLGDLFD
ncbi:zf-TFIIB domain-containing protein [Paenibacillus cisolokensis]|uniref:TFIIB-type zinc ribbon-containing protein n=1 Tax=Paenibacillus cisolokensis TaxID=1658519 RepID=UPI003D28B4AD